MVRLLKWFSVVLFVAVPFLVIASIWFGEIKFFFISAVVALFSILSGAFSDALKVQSSNDPTLF